jgi:chromosome segregation ATPase
VARKAHQSGRGEATNPRRSQAPSKPDRGAKKASGTKKLPQRNQATEVRASRIKRIPGSTSTVRANARTGAEGEREIAAQLAEIENKIGGFGAVLGRLEGALVKFAQSATRLDGALERLTAAVQELESWIKKSAGSLDKLQGHAAAIETKLERFKVDNLRALDLIGLKLDRIVNGVAELRRTVSPPGQRVGASFA